MDDNTTILAILIVLCFFFKFHNSDRNISKFIKTQNKRKKGKRNTKDSVEILFSPEMKENPFNDSRKVLTTFGDCFYEHVGENLIPMFNDYKEKLGYSYITMDSVVSRVEAELIVNKFLFLKNRDSLKNYDTNN